MNPMPRCEARHQVTLVKAKAQIPCRARIGGTPSAERYGFFHDMNYHQKLLGPNHVWVQTPIYYIQWIIYNELNHQYNILFIYYIYVYYIIYIHDVVQLFIPSHNSPIPASQAESGAFEWHEWAKILQAVISIARIMISQAWAVYLRLWSGTDHVGLWMMLHPAWPKNY